MRPRLPVLVLLVLVAPALAQEKPRKPSADAIPGYTRKTIEGFTVLLHKQVLEEEEKSKLARKPLAVLEMELKTVTRIMTPSALRVLRGLWIWVEWDERVDLPNGRGAATAVYYGGHQLDLLGEGKHPLKAKNISVQRLCALADEHQPGSDSGRCVLLHEIAHAVHDQLLSFDNAPVKAAYMQGLERKLYDKSLYAATNQIEFFAEMTGAYLDRLEYYPHNRADLKKHDPVTYKLMDTIWGKSSKAGGTDTPETKPEFATRVTLGTVQLGKNYSGPEVKLEDLKGRPVLLVYWENHELSLAALGKVRQWHEELADFGLAVVGVVQEKKPSAELKTLLESREVAFTILGPTFLDVQDRFTLPHAFLFDHTGKCLFRGAPTAGEDKMRAAVGEALVASLGKEPRSVALKPVVDGLKKGQAPPTMLARLTALSTGGKPELAEEVRALVDRMTEVGQKRFPEAEGLAKSDPVKAFLLAESLAVRYKNTPLAMKANRLTAQLRTNKLVTAELAARPTLKLVQQLDTTLTGRAGIGDPRSAGFQKANQLALQQMLALLQKMKKSWPNTQATAEALRRGDRYGLTP